MCLQSDVRQLLAEFQHEVDVPDGKLMISAMAEEHIPEATDLLATSFADAVGYMPMYRYCAVLPNIPALLCLLAVKGLQ